MSIISSSLIVISLLCLISLSTSVNASRRLVGVIVYRELPRNATSFQEDMKNNERVQVGNTTNNSSSQVNATKVSKEHMMKLMKKERKTKPKNEDDHDHKAEHVINRKHGRQDGARRAYTINYSARLGKRKIPRVVSWRVTRLKNEVPQTGFNLDYAPPKVHPPTHN